MIAMYAVVKTGGKQYRVAKDDTILVEKLDAEEGQKVTLSDVMLLGEGDNVTVGTPYCERVCRSTSGQPDTRSQNYYLPPQAPEEPSPHIRSQTRPTLLKITDINSSAKSSCSSKESSSQG